jgi:hypothetical protein
MGGGTGACGDPQPELLDDRWEIVLSDLVALFRMPPTARTDAILGMAEALSTQSRSLDRALILDFVRAICACRTRSGT